MGSSFMLLGVGDKGGSTTVFVTLTGVSNGESVAIDNVGPNWANPSFIRVDDTSFATVTYLQDAGSGPDQSHINATMTASFAGIPSGATITAATMGVICTCNRNLLTYSDATLSIAWYTGTFGNSAVGFYDALNPYSFGTSNSTAQITLEQAVTTLPTVAQAKAMWVQIYGAGDTVAVQSVTYSVDFVYMIITYK